MLFQAAMDTTVNAVATQVTISGIVVAAIQWFKNSKSMGWINSETPRLNRWLGVAAAALSSIGVHIAWNHGAVPGSYMIAVSGLTIMGILGGAFDFAKSLVFQEIIYRSTRPIPPVVIAPATGKPVVEPLAPLPITDPKKP